MDQLAEEQTRTTDREIIISRLFDAPRELVWEAMTNPKHVANWWGPNGFTTTIEKMDFRVGGVWKHVMHGPDGTDYPNLSVFLDIVKPERIVYSHGGGKEGGPGVHFTATWTFEARGRQTLLTMRSVFDTAAERDLVVREYGAIEGGKQTLARLAGYLPRMTPFVISRTFSAAPETVWKAWTESERLNHWFGPQGCVITTARLDFRADGSFHYCLRMPDGAEMWGKWIYREIVPMERLVVINSFSDANGGVTRHPTSPTWPREMLSTTTFAGQGGKTLLTIEWSPYNATDEERVTFDASHVAMTQGWTGTFEQLAAYLSGSKP
jgi:uncharacterized protein YndB with AHSA1/START domain